MLETSQQDTVPIPTLTRPLVLIGMMGAGKSTIGRHVAERLGVTFKDADREIEEAAGRTVEEIFAEFGEEHFRSGERRVIERLLQEPPFVLATGGGAYIDAETRSLIAEKALCVWLRAEFDVLWGRVSRRSHRPLLKTADPQGTLAGLMEARYPVYAEADIVVESENIPKDEMAMRVVDAISDYLASEKPA